MFPVSEKTVLWKRFVKKDIKDNKGKTLQENCLQLGIECLDMHKEIVRAIESLASFLCKLDISDDQKKKVVDMCMHKTLPFLPTYAPHKDVVIRNRYTGELYTIPSGTELVIPSEFGDDDGIFCDAQELRKCELDFTKVKKFGYVVSNLDQIFRTTFFREKERLILAVCLSLMLRYFESVPRMRDTICEIDELKKREVGRHDIDTFIRGIYPDTGCYSMAWQKERDEHLEDIQRFLLMSAARLLTVEHMKWNGSAESIVVNSHFACIQTILMEQICCRIPFMSKRVYEAAVEAFDALSSPFIISIYKSHKNPYVVTQAAKYYDRALTHLVVTSAHLLPCMPTMKSLPYGTCIIAAAQGEIWDSKYNKYVEGPVLPPPMNGRNIWTLQYNISGTETWGEIMNDFITHCLCPYCGNSLCGCHRRREHATLILEYEQFIVHIPQENTAIQTKSLQLHLDRILDHRDTPVRFWYCENTPVTGMVVITSIDYTAHYLRRAKEVDDFIITPVFRDSIRSDSSLFFLNFDIHDECHSTEEFYKCIIIFPVSNEDKIEVSKMEFYEDHSIPRASRYHVSRSTRYTQDFVHIPGVLIHGVLCTISYERHSTEVNENFERLFAHIYPSFMQKPTGIVTIAPMDDQHDGWELEEEEDLVWRHFGTGEVASVEFHSMHIYAGVVDVDHRLDTFNHNYFAGRSFLLDNWEELHSDCFNRNVAVVVQKFIPDEAELDVRYQNRNNLVEDVYLKYPIFFDIDKIRMNLRQNQIDQLHYRKWSDIRIRPKSTPRRFAFFTPPHTKTLVSVHELLQSNEFFKAMLVSDYDSFSNTIRDSAKFSGCDEDDFPDVDKTLQEAVTVERIFDAVSHKIEAYTSPDTTPHLIPVNNVIEASLFMIKRALFNERVAGKLSNSVNANSVHKDIMRGNTSVLLTIWRTAIKSNNEPVLLLVSLALCEIYCVYPLIMVLHDTVYPREAIKRFRQILKMSKNPPYDGFFSTVTKPQFENLKMAFHTDFKNDEKFQRLLKMAPDLKGYDYDRANEILIHVAHKNHTHTQLLTGCVVPTGLVSTSCSSTTSDVSTTCSPTTACARDFLGLNWNVYGFWVDISLEIKKQEFLGGVRELILLVKNRAQLEKNRQIHATEKIWDNIRQVVKLLRIASDTKNEADFDSKRAMLVRIREKNYNNGEMNNYISSALDVADSYWEAMNSPSFVSNKSKVGSTPIEIQYTSRKKVIEDDDSDYTSKRKRNRVNRQKQEKKKKKEDPQPWQRNREMFNTLFKNGANAHIEESPFMVVENSFARLYMQMKQTEAGDIMRKIRELKRVASDIKAEVERARVQTVLEVGEQVSLVETVPEFWDELTSMQKEALLQVALHGPDARSTLDEANNQAVLAQQMQSADPLPFTAGDWQGQSN